MPKTKISEYSATNSSNTDIEGINIDEGCAPSGINNAIRELMVHLKEFQTGASGDAFTFAGGTLMSGTNTISGAAIISGNINSSGTNTFSGSNVMSFSGGSSASPSIYFASDTNTGIFSPAADTIAFTEGGAESMRIDSSGNLLVGGTSQSGTANRVAVFSGNKFGLSIIDTTAQTTGVGGALNLGGNYRAAGDAQAFTRIAALKENSTDANYAYAMGFYTTPNGGGFEERMRIDSSGNLLVGTTTSSGANITVYGSSEARTIYQNSTSGTGANNGFYVGTSGADALLYHYENGPLLFATNNTERARITSGGNFLVGTDNSSQEAGVGFKVGYSATVPTVNAVVNTNGNSSTYHLYNTNATDNGYRFYVSANGGISNYSGNNINLSDERTKTNIELAGGYLAKICAIPVKLFNYRDEPEGEQRTLGVTAQDVEVVAPEFVNNKGWKGTAPEDGVPLKTIYTTDMMFGLMKAIQELKAELDATKAEVAALKASNGN